MTARFVVVVFLNDALFPLGECVITPGAEQVLESIQVKPATLLRRHQSGDWGEICEEDRISNEEAIKNGFRLLSVYDLASAVRVWVITEADRSVTTILLPSEY